MLDKSLIGVGKVEVSFENTCLFFKCEGYSCYLKKKKEKLRFLGENTLYPFKYHHFGILSSKV